MPVSVDVTTYFSQAMAPVCHTHAMPMRTGASRTQRCTGASVKETLARQHNMQAINIPIITNLNGLR